MNGPDGLAVECGSGDREQAGMQERLRLQMERMETPIGELIVVCDEQGRLRATDWSDHGGRMMRFLERSYGAGSVEGACRSGWQAAGESDAGRSAGGSGAVIEALRRYFAGEHSALDGIEVEAVGTAFQRAVWGKLREIPCGATISYAELAERVGNPKAVRAVGLANGANPVGVVVPCHRVVGTDGSMTGYAGGLERKRWLLQHEARQGMLTIPW